MEPNNVANGARTSLGRAALNTRPLTQFNRSDPIGCVLSYLIPRPITSSSPSPVA